MVRNTGSALSKEGERKARAMARARYAQLRESQSMSKPHIPQATTSANQRHPIVRIFGLLMLVLLVGSGCLFYKVYQDLELIQDYLVPAREQPYELKDGATLASVTRDLAGKDYHPRVLNLWVKLNHEKFPVIQKGDYAIDGTKTLSQILKDMCEGNVVRLKLPTVPLVEGMNIAMIQRRLEAKGDFALDAELSQIFTDAKDFITKSLVTNPEDESLLLAIGGSHESLEGLLMPATYDYEPEKTKPSQLLAKALVNMASFMREVYIDRDKSIDEVVKNPYEVLILASLVERESSLASERPLIAAVFLNRLHKGIMLQTDPAVMYGVSPDFKGPLRRSQLKKDTPYNTYTRKGLPPTPIAIPSNEAILAVLHPAESEALFFVAKSHDPQDGHLFSNNLREHNKAVQQYRKAVRDYKTKQAQEQELQANSASEAEVETEASNITIK